MRSTKSFDFRMSKHGDLFVRQGSLHTIIVVTKPIIIFLFQVFIVLVRGLFLSFMDTRLSEELSLEMVQGIVGEMSFVEGVKICLAIG